MLDGKKSLNVNIFLKQFRNTNTEITRMIHVGDHETIGLEKLRGLLKILPEFDELETLRNFDGDKTKLGNAEKFLLQLMQVPKYVILMALKKIRGTEYLNLLIFFFIATN